MLSYLHAAESFSGQVMARGDPKIESLNPVVNAHLSHHPEFLGAYAADENGISLLNQSRMEVHFHVNRGSPGRISVHQIQLCRDSTEIQGR
jgi:hypothetical protein